ncbi:PREDICTED: 6-phosphogluconolactonase [Myotis davidii]|uniref:6-phosphogluconolactonase n=1 Tax=Myotis davidii TaxID=225400 RepID=UPI0007676573|nr:PREDICTED: 6-phosphogluconolactonase [Myotis davidii]
MNHQCVGWVFGCRVCKEREGKSQAGVWPEPGLQPLHLQLDELSPASTPPAAFTTSEAVSLSPAPSDLQAGNGAGEALTHLLSKLPIPDSQVITIDPQLPVEEAAEDYAKKLRQAFQGDSIPVFDLLILGVGPDGHTCSLFPDHPLLQEREKIVAPISDSPKPPPQRVTLTLPVLNAARTVIFVATGEGKAAVLKRILEDKEASPLPAALVQPHTGKLCWFLDEAAARLLTVPFEKHSTL